MSTNSVVIKTGIFTEWFQPHLIPLVPVIHRLSTALAHAALQVVHVHSFQARLFRFARYPLVVSPRAFFGTCPRLAHCVVSEEHRKSQRWLLTRRPRQSP